ncbi:exported hypothetical protein [Paraburkholderia piptadeniae]|uniref:Uncharacterized protein n=1 Tax=Paraburkholderia piptadeniae TaxID=1701573 RepID=A0A1N7RWJ2_9BURK|nr:exported hypothetical protein [Paraburkholderia piptadeniae]
MRFRGSLGTLLRGWIGAGFVIPAGKAAPVTAASPTNRAEGLVPRHTTDVKWEQSALGAK